MKTKHKNQKTPTPKTIITNHISIIMLLTTAAFTGLCKTQGDSIKNPTFITEFSGERAYQDVEYQLSLGPRYVGSPGHSETSRWITSKLDDSGWETTIQEGELMGFPIMNIIAKRGSGVPWIIFGAHYDTRIFADKDEHPEHRNLPVPGANDGASGVAFLLEFARILPADLPYKIWLVFFDAEDNGNINGWDWILGSRYFVDELLAEYPDYMVLVDMIGDKNLNIYLEKNSNQSLSSEIWGIAANLGYSNYFIPKRKYSIIDDHIPFIEVGIPAVNIIDFDYPYWHTIEDTADKVSPESLEIVGTTLLAWLKNTAP
jgi:Zn-dependent M28 family amino/carboxypeptidase